VKNWHDAPPDAAPPVDEHGRSLLALTALNTGERLEVPAASPLGGFSAIDLDRASVLLREPSSGNRHPIEPRLLDLVFRIQLHFGAPEVRVLSGYRTPARGGASNHGKGRAVDFVVPAATDADVAAFARTLGFVGVGIYPVSGFVHVDVRDRSYFWSDGSGPGHRNRERGILGDVARAADREASVRGERVTSPLSFGLDVDAALRAGVTHPASDDDDDDDG
jgi:uncharacterized protein YcbK (DUF882 family)